MSPRVRVAIVIGVLALAGCATRGDLVNQDRRLRGLLQEQRRQVQSLEREVERLRADERQFRTRLRTLLGTTLQTVRDHEEMIAEPAGELTMAG